MCRYEAYVLYIFMQLLIQFLGGESNLIVHLEFKVIIYSHCFSDELSSPGHFIHFNHYKLISKTIHLLGYRIFLRRVKQGVLQFVLIKPCTSLLALFLHKYPISFSSPTLYLSLLNNLSISLSLYSLILFYLATEERLKPFNPLSKFLCIKAILFFSFWQGCAFALAEKHWEKGKVEEIQ